jgi:hypothetical protein
MIRSLAEHLDGLPAEQHRHIAFIQVKTGCTGSPNGVAFNAAGGDNGEDEDAGAAEMKTGYNVEGRGDRQWHTETVQVSDAVMEHGGDRGSDFALVNTDERDDLFSLIELHRDRSEE